MSDGDAAQSRFAINVSTNLIYLVLSTLLILWYIPFLIEHLGIAAYGLVPLVSALVSYAAIVADSLNLTLLRFLAIDLNQKNWEAANRTFNTSLSVISLFSAAVLPLFIAVAWFFPYLFHVPPGFETESRLLFAGAAIALLVMLVESSFSASMLILHRFELRGLIQGVSLLTRVGVVVLAFELLGPHPWQVGLAFVASALVSLFGSWLIWRRLTPQLSIRWFQIDSGQLRAMSALGRWAVVVRIGILLFSSTDLIVVNIVFGAEMSGRYGALLLFAELVRSLAQTGASVLGPAIIARYARQESTALRSLAARAVKLMSLAVALPIGLICGFAEPLLSTWLGQGFAPFSLLLAAIMGPLVVSAGILPLAYVLTSHNKIQLQGISTLVLGGVNIGLAVAVALWSGLGPIGVALVTMVVLTCNNLLLAAFSARVMDLPWHTFYPTLLSGVLHALAVALAAYGLTQAWWPDGWLQLGIEAAGLAFVYGAAVFFLSLNADRAFLLRLLRTARRHGSGRQESL